MGVGWRRHFQSSFGLIREVKGQHMIWGQQTRDDSGGVLAVDQAAK